MAETFSWISPNLVNEFGISNYLCCTITKCVSLCDVSLKHFLELWPCWLTIKVLLMLVTGFDIFFLMSLKHWSNQLTGWWNWMFPWWHHQMETFSALLALYAGEFRAQRKWCRTLMFSFICAWINGWVNNREAGDLRRHRAHYDVNVMYKSRHASNDPLCMVEVRGHQAIDFTTLSVFCFKYSMWQPVEYIFKKIDGINLKI